MDILEIGAGRTPYFIRYGLSLSSSDHYIGLDHDEEWLRQGRNSILRLMDKNELSCTAAFEFADARRLPFPGPRFDLVVFSNVLTAPLWQKVGGEEGLAENENAHRRENEALLQEALRVLKPGGIIRIYADIRLYGMGALEEMLAQLRRSGSILVQEKPEQAAAVRRYTEYKIAKKLYSGKFLEEVLPRPMVYEIAKNSSVRGFEERKNFTADAL